MSWSDASPLNRGCILSGAFLSAHAAPMVIDPTDPNTLYVGESDDQDGYSALLKSTNGGANWSTAWDWFTGLQLSVRALAIDPAHPATLYLGLDDGSRAGVECFVQEHRWRRELEQHRLHQQRRQAAGDRSFELEDHLCGDGRPLQCPQRLSRSVQEHRRRRKLGGNQQRSGRRDRNPFDHYHCSHN